VIIDGGGAMFIDRDIMEVIDDFVNSAEQRKIEVVVRNMPRVSFNLLSALGKRSS
jgi:hypothetical protein